MSDAHRHYLIVEQGVGAGVVNLLLNGIIAWALFRHLTVVPLWGQESVAGDTVATCFLLPFITCLIVSGLAQREVARGRFAAPEWCRASHPILGRLPAGRFLRGVAFGAACVILIAPVTLVGLSAAGFDQVHFWRFIIFKALYAGFLGAAVTPIIALCALGDLSSAAAPRRAA
jgi:hypothetical protein